MSRTGAVSPAARATPRITAVTRPALAVGRTTLRTMRRSGAPRLSAASRSVPGTRRRTSSEVRITVGIMMIAIDMAAAKPEKPSNFRGTTQIMKMNRPAMTEGIPLMASTTTLSGTASLPGISLRYTAARTASGVVTSVARPTCSRVPTIACRAPIRALVSRTPPLLKSWVQKLGNSWPNAAYHPLSRT